MPWERYKDICALVCLAFAIVDLAEVGSATAGKGVTGSPS